jgi:hypothetical protein
MAEDPSSGRQNREKTFDPRPKVVQTLREITSISANPGLRNLFLDRLQRSEADIEYPDLLYAFGALHDPQEVAHIRKHWFGMTPTCRGDWFKDWQPLRRKFRDAMTQAFRLSQAKNVPIVVYWVVGEHLPVEHVILPHDTQISVFRMTPLPPERIRREADEDQVKAE